MNEDEYTLEQFRKIVSEKNAEVDRNQKNKPNPSTVHSTQETFSPDIMDKFMKEVEPVLRRHFTGIISEEIDRDRIVFRTNERIVVEIKIKEV